MTKMIRGSLGFVDSPTCALPPCNTTSMRAAWTMHTNSNELCGCCSEGEGTASDNRSARSLLGLLHLLCSLRLLLHAFHVEGLLGKRAFWANGPFGQTSGVLWSGVVHSMHGRSTSHARPFHTQHSVKPHNLAMQSPALVHAPTGLGTDGETDDSDIYCLTLQKLCHFIVSAAERPTPPPTANLTSHPGAVSSMMCFSGAKPT